MVRNIKDFIATMVQFSFQAAFFFFFSSFKNLIFFFKIYIIVLVLPNIKINPPQLLSFAIS